MKCFFLRNEYLFFLQKLKLNDFVSPSQLPDLRKTIHYGKKSIAIRKTLPGTYHKVSLPSIRNGGGGMVFDATNNNISVITWLSKPE